MKFKKHFMVFCIAWAAVVMIISDILLISAYRSIPLNTEKGGAVPAIIVVPTIFAAVCYLLVGLFARYVIRRLRRGWHALEGNDEYPFFRNYVCVLAAGAAANTLLLYNRYCSVMQILIKDERRRLNMLFYDKPELMRQYFAELENRIAACNAAALIMTAVLLCVKVYFYLTSARALVKIYHKAIKAINN